jgi:hypothetical protein
VLFFDAQTTLANNNTSNKKNKKKDLERERNITYIRLLPAIRL